MNFLLQLLSTTLLFTTILAISIADIQSQLPKCSLQCLVSGAAEHGCNIQDIPCMCSKIEPMIKTVSPCLVKAGCQLEDITDTAKVVFQICQDGVNGTMNATNSDPTASSTPSAAATPSLTAAAAHLSQGVAWTVIAAIAIAAVLF